MEDNHDQLSQSLLTLGNVLFKQSILKINVNGFLVTGRNILKIVK